MMKNQFSGIVENGEFQICSREVPNCTSYKLTRIPVQAAQSPESAKIDLSSYEGQNITVRGKENGCWIFSAEVIKHWSDYEPQNF